MTFLLLMFHLFCSEAQAVRSEVPLQVEGLILGFYPSLGDGIRVNGEPGSKAIQFNPGQRCLKNVTTSREGLGYQGLSFDEATRQDVRDKLVGLIGYPASVENEDSKDWLNGHTSLAANYYMDNLAREPDGKMIQMLFVPMVLAPKPVMITRAELTPEAKDIFHKKGWSGLEDFCGTHFVAALGEENFVIYSIRIHLADESQRYGIDRVALDVSRQSPSLVMNNLFRMRQRLEFTGPKNTVTLDVLQVGGSPEELEAVRQNTIGIPVNFKSENVGDSVVTRAQLTCVPDHLEPCETVVQTFLDFQFRRLNVTGEKPSFTPVRFRIAPLRLIEALN